MWRITKSYKLAIQSILIAIIIIQVMIPFLGYIPLGVVNITFIPVTIIIGSSILGYKSGMHLGLVYGIAKLIIAFTAPQSIMDILVFQNPFITIIPRVLIGITSGITFYLLKKYSITLASIFAGAIGSITNTFFTLFAIILLKANTLISIYHTNHLTTIIKSIILINSIPELVVSVILTPLIINALLKYIK